MQIRIISGERRGKKLHSVPGLLTRPTADRVRESIFNIIGDRVRDTRVLDLFAGTGILGIEALSRGAEFALFVDDHSKPITVIKKNLAACHYESRSRVLQLDLSRAEKRMSVFEGKFQLAFMDPPYDQHLIAPMLSWLHQEAVLASGALVVAEHGVASPSFEPLAPFILADQRKYGKTLVSFLDYTL